MAVTDSGHEDEEPNPRAHSPRDIRQGPAQVGEARQHFRPPTKLVWPVEFEVLAVPEPSAGLNTVVPPVRHHARTHGISIGGTFIETEMQPQVGRSLRLWLLPPNEDPHEREVIRLHGEIRWVSDGTDDKLPKGFGVAFRALTATDEVRLHLHFSRAGDL